MGKGLFNVDGFWGAAGAKMSMGGRRGALNAHCSVASAGVNIRIAGYWW